MSRRIKRIALVLGGLFVFAVFQGYSLAQMIGMVGIVGVFGSIVCLPLLGIPVGIGRRWLFRR